MPCREMLSDWFQRIDSDDSGTVTLLEFFVFSLREALPQLTGEVREAIPPELE